jgi:hypothetical protein
VTQTPCGRRPSAGAAMPIAPFVPGCFGGPGLSRAPETRITSAHDEDGTVESEADAGLAHRPDPGAGTARRIWEHEALHPPEGSGPSCGQSAPGSVSINHHGTRPPKLIMGG